MQPDLSIIVPVYNVEKFLGKCLDSVLLQDWGNTTVEVIAVDDESPDGSAEIAREYASRFPNLKVISQKNKGLGGARNTGIENASGQYLFFLDSDDYLIPGKLQPMVQKAISSQVDVLELAANRVDESGAVLSEIFQINAPEIQSGQEFIAKYPFANSACNKLYRRDFLIENQLRFLERVYVEDAPFNVEVFVKARKVCAIPEIVVSYLQNAASITRANRDPKRLGKFINDGVTVTSRMFHFANSGILPQAREKLLEKVSVFVTGIVLMVIRSEKPFQEKKADIDALKKAGLYPVKTNPGSGTRNLFRIAVNQPMLLGLLLRLTSKNNG